MDGDARIVRPRDTGSIFEVCTMPHSVGSLTFFYSVRRISVEVICVDKLS